MPDHAGFPPGHFYSPVVDTKDPHAISAVRNRIPGTPPAGIQLDSSRQREMMQRLAFHHREFRFPRHQEEPYRFYFDNPFFGPHDASVLFSMLLEFKPARVIEVGCGHSSCLLLDTNEIFFDGALALTFIDPSLSEVRHLFGEKETGRARFWEQKLQDVPVSVVDELAENDILFLDSSHVCKTGSDVNHYMFQILPRLKTGVLIHVHDILYPFEYPEGWVLEEKRSWNEAYVLRAFLEYNAAFEIVYWNNFVWHHLKEDLRALMPLCMENEGGSLWLRRTR